MDKGLSRARGEERGMGCSCQSTHEMGDVEKGKTSMSRSGKAATQGIHIAVEDNEQNREPSQGMPRQIAWLTNDPTDLLAFILIGGLFVDILFRVITYFGGGK